MHHHDHNNALGWLLWALGSMIGFLQSYGLGMLSALCMVGGLVIQWKTYKLREAASKGAKG